MTGNRERITWSYCIIAQDRLLVFEEVWMRSGGGLEERWRRSGGQEEVAEKGRLKRKRRKDKSQRVKRMKDIDIFKSTNTKKFIKNRKLTCASLCCTSCSPTPTYFCPTSTSCFSFTSISTFIFFSLTYSSNSFFFTFSCASLAPPPPSHSPNPPPPPP